MERAIIYLRRSQAQLTEGSIGTQRADCQSWCAANNVEVVAIHTDDDKSAYRQSNRTGFGLALDAIQSGEATTLVAWRLDRLSRRGIGQVGEVLDQLEAAGGRAVFVNEGLDSSMPGQRMVIAIKSEMARSESESTGVRVSRAKQQSLADLRWPGGKAPFGYRVDDGQRLVLDPEVAPVLREVVQAVLDGGSTRDAVSMLNESPLKPERATVWANSSVARALRSPALAGFMPDQRVTGGKRPPLGTFRRDDTGAPIVIVAGETVLSPDEYRRLQETLDSRTTGLPGSRRAVHGGKALLSGLLVCGGCGGRMSCDRSSGSYRCNRRGKLGCTGRGVSIERTEREVVERSLRWLQTLDPQSDEIAAVADAWLAVTKPKIGTEVQVDEQAVADLRARLDDLADARFLHGSVTAEQYDRLSVQLKQALTEAVARVAAVPRSLGVGVLLDLAQASDEPEGGLQAQGSAWAAMPPELQQTVLRVLVKRVHIRAEGLDIEHIS